MKIINTLIITASAILAVMTLLPLSMMPHVPYFVGEGGHVVLFFLLSVLLLQKLNFDIASYILFTFATAIEVAQKAMHVGRSFDFEDIFWGMVGVYIALFLNKLNHFRMKKLITFLLLGAMSLTASAQCPTAPNCPLAVEITSFTAVEKNGVVNLSWATASEVNAKQFEIERSGDGVNFLKIGTVAAQNKPSTYHFADDALLSIGAYYRLLEVDFNGKATVFKAVFVEKTTQIGRAHV